jgi:acyl carrier protein
MTVQPTAASTTDRVLFSEITGILRDVTGESAEWAERITPNDRLEADLGFESVELLELAELLKARYGERVNLVVHYAGLTIDEIIGLTTADLADYVARHRAGPTADAGTDPTADAGTVPGPPPAVPGRAGEPR